MGEVMQHANYHHGDAHLLAHHRGMLAHHRGMPESMHPQRIEARLRPGRHTGVAPAPGTSAGQPPADSAGEGTPLRPFPGRVGRSAGGDHRRPFDEVGASRTGSVTVWLYRNDAPTER